VHHIDPEQQREAQPGFPPRDLLAAGDGADQGDGGGARHGVGPVGVDPGSHLPAGNFVVVGDRVQLEAQMKLARLFLDGELSKQQLDPQVERLVRVEPGRRGPGSGRGMAVIWS
jgi:hypothetical protein